MAINLRAGSRIDPCRLFPRFRVLRVSASTFLRTPTKSTWASNSFVAKPPGVHADSRPSSRSCQNYIRTRNRKHAFMATIRVDDESIRRLRGEVLRKYGKLHGPLLLEVNAALLD